ncbi:MAG TPA: hypothetical protein VGJ91_22695, partial [Polyangiaceae bacterium]
MIGSVAAISALLVLGSALAYLHTASGRGFLAKKVSAWVSRELVSQLRIEGIAVLANDRLVISGATLFDAQGRAVLRLHGLSAELDAWTLLANVAFGPTVRIELPKLHAERLEVGLYRAETGGVSLSHAFDSRTPSAVPEKPGKDLRIHFSRIAIDCLSARTDLAGLAQATAELRALTASFDWSKDSVSLGLATDDVRVQRVLPVDGTARLRAQVKVPGTAEATLDGSIGALPVHASFRQTGHELALTVSSAGLTPEAMRVLVPTWPIHEPVTVEAE